jgi:hypothetical protein
MNELLRENHIPLARDVRAAFCAKNAKVPPGTQRKARF